MSHPDAIESLRRLLRIFTVLVVLLITYVTWQSIASQAELVGNNRAGCLRSTQDRLDGAEGWRTAEQARRASADKAGPIDGADDLRAAERYDRIASSLEARTRQTAAGRVAYCEVRFPSASLLPF